VQSRDSILPARNKNHAYLCCDNYLQTVSQKIELLALGRSGQRKKHKGDGEFKHWDQMPLW
jgi:hypothetical protein